MSILKELDELTKAGVISDDTADQIQAYYSNKNQNTSSRLVVIFAILGALLVGLGIILILAHNWDQFNRITKTSISFLPLLIGQLLSFYVILKKAENSAWRESTSTFLFFAIGASISLISQVYHLPGDLSSFLLVWMLLACPVIYLLRSNVIALFYLIGITVYACDIGYDYNLHKPPYLFIVLFSLILPRYYHLIKEKTYSNFTYLFHWFISLSITIVLASFNTDSSALFHIIYFSLFSLFYLIGESPFLNQNKIISNAYKVCSVIGSLYLLYYLSFADQWNNIIDIYFTFDQLIHLSGFWTAIILAFTTLFFLYKRMTNGQIKAIRPYSFLFLLMIPTLVLGLFSSLAVYFVNLYIFIIAIFTIRLGSERSHLGLTNLGMIIITILIICRFVDSDLSFVTRGILFISVGIGFFISNYYMLKRRKTNA